MCDKHKWLLTDKLCAESQLRLASVTAERAALTHIFSPESKTQQQQHGICAVKFTPSPCETT